MKQSTIVIGLLVAVMLGCGSASISTQPADSPVTPPATPETEHPASAVSPNPSQNSAVSTATEHAADLPEAVNQGSPTINTFTLDELLENLGYSGCSLILQLPPGDRDDRFIGGTKAVMMHCSGE